MMYEAKNKRSKGSGFKISATIQMLQRFPISLAQVKASNNSKEITKIIYKNIISLSDNIKLHSFTYKQ